MKKKLLALLMVVAMVATGLIACGGDSSETTAETKAEDKR